MLRGMKKNACHLKVHNLGDGNIAQLVEHLPGIQGLLSFIPGPQKISVYAYNPNLPTQRWRQNRKLKVIVHLRPA